MWWWCHHMPIQRSTVLTNIFLFHQVRWKLQRQQVWAVWASQQQQQCRGGRFNRSPGHRGSARLSDTGCCCLLCTQVSGLFFQELARFCKLQIGYYSLILIFLKLIGVPRVHLQDAESQTAEPTEHSATVLESKIQSMTFLPVCAGFDGTGVPCIVGPGNVLDKTVIDQLTTGEWH